MLFTSAVLAFQIVLAYAAPWEGVAREEPSNYGNGAWYQMPQPAQYPTSAYDRVAQSNAAAGYAGYPRPYSRSPDYYPESSVSNNMVPPIGARKSPAIGYGYPNAASAAAAGAMMSTQDPNAELIAAIKDVVKKFKQSLDRTGVQDDVRQMGSQLETTWNDLRRGKLDQWIERAHQMLADAVTEEEAELLLAAEKARNDAIAATKHKSPAANKPSGTQQQQYNFVRVSPNKAAVSKAKLQQQPQP